MDDKKPAFSNFEASAVSIMPPNEHNALLEFIILEEITFTMSLYDWNNDY